MLSLATREALEAARNLLPLLAARIVQAAANDLLDHTHIIVLDAADSEAAITAGIGWSPLIHPIDCVRYGKDDTFTPYWDWLQDHGGWFELILTVGTNHAYTLFIADDEAELASMCRANVR